MKLFKLGTLRKGLIYPLNLLIYLFIRTIHTKILKKYIIGDSRPKNQSDILLTMLMSLGEFLASFLKTFYKRKKKANKKNNFIQSFNYANLIFVVKKTRYKIGLISLLFLLILATFLDLSSYLVWIFISIYNNDFPDQLVMDLKYKIFQLFLATICCKIILKKPIYQHHIFSIICSFFVVLIIFILDFALLINTEKIFKTSDYFLTLFFLIFTNLLFAVHETLEKYLMDEVFINPFDLLRFEGIIGLILIIPFFFIYFFVKCKSDHEDHSFNYCEYSFSNIFEYFRVRFDFDSKLRLFFVILNYIIFTFESSLVNVYSVLNTKFFSPMYSSICDSCMMPLTMIIYFIIDDKYKYPTILIIDFIFYMPIIFLCLVFNEIILLKFWNLSYNTFDEISERARNKEILCLEDKNDKTIDDDDEILPETFQNSAFY